MFSSLIDFRQQLYPLFTKRHAATMDLIDALSSHSGLSSVTQLRLSQFFRRKYNSITKVIDEFGVGSKKSTRIPCSQKRFEDKKSLFHLTGKICPFPRQRNFFVWNRRDASGSPLLPQT